MQTTTAKTTLLSALNDPQGSTYSNQDIEAALNRSLIAYSYYFPAERAMGQGTLVSSVKSGSTSFEMIGGFPAVGTTYTIGYGSFASENCTVTSVEYTPFNTYNITISAPLANQY